MPCPQLQITNYILKITLFCYLVLVQFQCISTIGIDIEPYYYYHYTEYLVKIGDPWNVTCYTQYDEPTRWIFTSALPFYNNFLYLNDQPDVTIEDRYNMIVKNRRHSYTLEVSKTDKYHAGFYQCAQRNGVILEGSLNYKLTLVDDSMIAFSKYPSGDVKLEIAVSYIGHKTPSPSIRCKFPYGDRIINEIVCKHNVNDLSRCHLERIYGPDDDTPTVCQIWFDNGRRHLWREETLWLIPESDISYVNEGESYHMRCDTTSTASMRWYFTQVSPNNKEIVLFDRWTIQSAALNRYNFTYSNDRKTYSMMITHVDDNHAGTYLCTHKSALHLVEKKIELIVIEKSSIELNHQQLLMFVSYASHNISTPTFQCNFGNEVIKLKNLKCSSSTHGKHECFFHDTLNLVDVVPSSRCQIWFENVLISEQNFIKGLNMFVPIDLTYHIIVTIVLCIILFVFV